MVPRGVPGSLVGVLLSTPRFAIASQDTLFTRAGRPPMRARAALFFAFAFAVMADPVSSGGLSHRGGAARAGRPSPSLDPNDGAGDRHHRAGHAELLAARASIPAGRRFARGGRTRVRRGVVVSADRCAGRRLRVDDRDRDLDRGRRQRPDRLPARAGGPAHTARASAGGRGGRADLVWPRRPDDLRGHDLPVHRRRGGDARARLRRPAQHTRSGANHPRRPPCAGRGHPRVPRRHGARDRHRGACYRDRAARPARRRWPLAVRSWHAAADDRHCPAR
jgi:hypothetical protein